MDGVLIYLLMMLAVIIVGGGTILFLSIIESKKDRKKNIGTTLDSLFEELGEAEEVRELTEHKLSIYDRAAKVGELECSLLAMSGEFEPEVNEKGDKFWYNIEGKLHRDGDKPAIIRTNGVQEWWRNGQRHRNGDKPAIEAISATGWWREWYKDDKRHRYGKPAMESSRGIKCFYNKGKLVKDETIPLIEHRVDWEFLKDIRKIWKRIGHEGVPNPDCNCGFLGPGKPHFCLHEKDGNKFWLSWGVLHREDDLPAVELKDGTKEWWIWGKRHRKGAPAVVRANGNKEWWWFGKRHREGDKPAIELKDGDKLWFKNGEYIRTEYAVIPQIQIKKEEK